MSYSYITDRDSPNFTAGSRAMATWGRARTIEAIAIHWWGDPNQNPSAEGIVNHLCNPAAGVSAHFVVTGTGRRAWQLVNFSDASWATNSANPYTISIECDPRCRDEDYDVVAEVIAQIRDAFGDLPLVPHKQFVATACPGNYDLGRLDRLARTKDGSGEWGTVRNKNSVSADQIKQVYRDLLGREADQGGLNTYLTSNFSLDRIRSEIMASPEYIERQKMLAAQEAARKAEEERKAAEKAAEEKRLAEEKARKEAEEAAKKAEEERKKAEEEAKANQPKPQPTPGNTLWDDILNLFKKVVEFLSKYKRS